MKILYVRGTFPKLSETFIMEEVIHLIRRGHDVRVTSNDFEAGTMHDKVVANDLFSHTVYPPPKPLRGRHRLTHLPEFLARLVLRPHYARRYLMNHVLGRPLDAAWLRDALRDWSLTDMARVVQRSSRIHNLSIAVRQQELAATPFEPDVIHCPFSFHWDTYELERVTRLHPRVPYTMTLRAGDLHGDQTRSHSWPTKRALIAGAADLITIARFNRDVLVAAAQRGDAPAPKHQRATFADEIARALTIDPAAIHIVHSSIDPRFFRPQPDIVKVPDQIACVARLTYSKGIEELIDGCGLLRDRGVRFRCVILGEGPLRAALTERVAWRGLTDRVELRSAASQDGVRALLAASSLFVLPCVVRPSGERDILPNSVKEAMAMELPVVTSDISGIGELVTHGVDGLLVAERSAAAVADAMAELLADAALRERMGAAARQKILAEFDVATEGAKLERILSAAVARARAGRGQSPLE